MARGRRQGAGSAVLTSLPLEILLYFGGWYDVIFWLIELLVFIYKGFELPYTKSAFGIEFSFVFLYLVIEPIRLFLGAISKTRTYTHARTHARTYVRHYHYYRHCRGGGGGGANNNTCIDEGVLTSTGYVHVSLCVCP